MLNFQQPVHRNRWMHRRSDIFACLFVFVCLSVCFSIVCRSYHMHLMLFLFQSSWSVPSPTFSLICQSLCSMKPKILKLAHLASVHQIFRSILYHMLYIFARKHRILQMFSLIFFFHHPFRWCNYVSSSFGVFAKIITRSTPQVVCVSASHCWFQCILV